ncbi:MAG: protoporphyrinogen oxidase [Planctomycetaceae bacterium]|nr:protoporphyrinogen oxidase [Planctomycetaceae bacterium]
MLYPSSSRIAVIGGGLTGLAAAHRLTELATEQGRALDITVYEAGPRLGGIVGTIERDGYLIDTGADSFITNKPGALQLCQRIGLESRLQATEPRYRGALVLHNGRPVPVPEGFQLLSPSAMWPVLKSPILSLSGKLRVAREYFIPPRMDNGDETLASFVRRRFGSEVLDRLVQPLVGGIYTSDPEKLSLAATMPRFLEMERKHGSLIRAAKSEKPQANDEDRISGGARYGLFAGLRGGMQELVDALVSRVESRCRVELNRAIESVTVDTTSADAVDTTSADAADAPGRPGYRLRFRDSSEQTFDAVLVTLPAYRTADVLQNLDHDLAAQLRGIEYASSSIVVTGHALKDVRDPLNAFGLVIPHIEHRKILAVSFSSRKFPNRAPEGRVLLRTFVGGAMQPELFDRDDDATIRLVREELAATLGVTGEPDFALVVRYPRGMPQYHLGHLDRVAEIERLTAGHTGLAIAGNAYRGVGVPDAIHSGEQAAERILAAIRQD